MPSVRTRLLFEKKVKELWEQGKNESEIAEILNVSTGSVGDARRRMGIYKTECESRKTCELATVIITNRVPKAKPCWINGRKYWDVSEFFGIWEG